MSPIQLHLILWGRRWLILAILTVTVAVAATVTYSMPTMYSATASLIVSYEDIVPYDDMNTQVQLSNSYMVTQVNIIQSRKVAEKVVDKLRLATDPKLRERFITATQGHGRIQDWLADWLLSRLGAEPSRASRIVDISFTADDPEFAARVANTFGEAYIDARLEMAVEPARQTTAWLGDQLNPLREKVQAARSKLTAYQREHDVVATDERVDIETARLQSLSSELLTAQSATHEARHRETQLNNLTADERSLEILPEIAGNGFIQNLKTELLRNENELAELGAELGENHPHYQRSRAEVRSLTRKLSTEIAELTRGIRDQAQLARERERTVAESLATQKQKVLDLKRQRDGISVLEREVDSAQRAYDGALTRFDQANMESLVTQTNVLMLNRATAPVKPAAPLVKRNLVIAVVLGSLLALGVALSVESRDRRVRSRQDLENYFGVPNLAALGGR